MIQNSNVALQLWSEYKQKFAGPYTQMLKSNELTLNGRTMHFKYLVKGDKPQNGYSLIFGFHGGGQSPVEVNDGQWNNHKYLYNKQLPGGVIWFAPRSLQNKSDMWHKEYMQDFILEIVRAFATNDMIDINKVFLTGFSAGGDGIYHMAPRMADFLAGAAMMAGHPNAINLMNIRNIGFSIQVGGNDTAYNRNLQAIKYIRMLNQLGQNYGGYQHQSKVHEGKPHWMDYQDAEVFPWLFAFTRNPYPNIILYKQCRVRPKQTFYYVRLGEPKNGNRDEQVVVIKEGNTFKVISNRVISIMVNSHMVNMSQPIKIIHNKTTTVERMPQPRIDVAQKTFFERIDPYYVFDDEIQSNPPQIIDVKQAMCEYFFIDPSQKQAQYEPELSFKPDAVPANFNRSLNPPPRKKKTMMPPVQQQIYSSGHQNHIQSYNNSPNKGTSNPTYLDPNQQQRVARQQQLHSFNPNEPVNNNNNNNINNSTGAPQQQKQTRNAYRCADDCCSIF